MIRLEKSQALERIIRQDDVTELAIPTWTLVSEAIQAGKVGNALDFLEYCRAENERNNNSLVSFVNMVLTQLASFDEELIEKLLRQRYYPIIRDWLSATPSVRQTIQLVVEAKRSHHGNITITEEPDRYLLKDDPCGTGGKLRRTGVVGTTKKAYPWSWGKSGVPYYCTHCCVQWEVLPVELQGYPLRVTLMGDSPEDPCTQLYYKKPELIPEEYFTRIGKTKPIK